uniref:Uncharacterized protein n=1 Tax=Setaria viridis TaxID=4556 RepID=A0A4U6U4H0_SETVI|nr:hypothetical protein SEVIR_6G169300v2 [Setaria viridis]
MASAATKLLRDALHGGASGARPPRSRHRARRHRTRAPVPAARRGGETATSTDAVGGGAAGSPARVKVGAWPLGHLRDRDGGRASPVLHHGLHHSCTFVGIKERRP